MVVSAEVLAQLAHMGGDAFGAPGAIKECFILLLDAFEQQAHKISHLEDTLCCSGQPHEESIWTQLASKADARKVDQLQRQVAALQAELGARQLQEAASAPEQERMHHQLTRLKQHVVQLEAAVGCTTGSSELGQHASVLSSLAARATGSSSALERLQQLEQQVEVLSDALASKEEESQQAHACIRDIESQLHSQLKNIRMDAKQAILLSGSATKADAEAQLAARSREVEHKLVARVEAVEAVLESRVASASTRTSAALSGEVDKRVAAVYDTLHLQIKGLQDQIDKLATDKADMASLSDYTLQVTEVFEQVAVTVSDSSQAGLDDVLQQLEQQRQATSALAAGKADRQEIVSLQRHVHEKLDGVAADASELRGSLEELSGLEDTVQCLEADVAALNSAAVSSSSALDACTRLTQQLATRCDDLAASHSHLCRTVLGSASSGPHNMHPTSYISPAEADGTSSSSSSMPPHHAQSPPGSTSIAARLAAAERASQEAIDAAGGKASAAVVGELGRQLEGVRAQAARNAEGVRNLTSSTYKRVDEHASAIQRLAATIGSSMDDRPTCAAVRKMVQEAVADATEHLEAQAAEQQDALAQHDAAIEAVTSAAEEAMREAAAVRQAQAELRSMQASRDDTLHECIEMVAKDQASIRETLRQAPGICKDATAELVKEQVSEELQQQAFVDSQRRLAALEVHARATASTMQHLEEESTQTIRQLDRHSGMLAALERASATAQQAVAGALNDDVATAVQEAVAKLRAEVEEQPLGRLGGMEEAVKEGRVAVREGLKGVEVAWRREMAEAAQQEEVRWQVWLEQFASAIEQRMTKDDLTAVIRSTERRLAQHLTTQTDTIAAAQQKALEAASTAAAAVDKRLAVVERRVRAVEGSATERAEAAAASSASTAGAAAKQLAELEAALHAKADKAAVERQLGALTAVAQQVGREELEGELAKKLDIAAFLAASSANARAVGAAGALAAALGGGAEPALTPRQLGFASAGNSMNPSHSKQQLAAGMQRIAALEARTLQQTLPGGKGTSPRPFR